MIYVKLIKYLLDFFQVTMLLGVILLDNRLAYVCLCAKPLLFLKLFVGNQMDRFVNFAHELHLINFSRVVFVDVFHKFFAFFLSEHESEALLHSLSELFQTQTASSALTKVAQKSRLLFCSFGLFCTPC